MYATKHKIVSKSIWPTCCSEVYLLFFMSLIQHLTRSNGNVIMLEELFLGLIVILFLSWKKYGIIYKNNCMNDCYDIFEYAYRRIQ